MFAKPSSLRTSAPTVSSAPGSQSKVSPAVKAEISGIYDRWTRTDMGGVIKAAKAAIGVLEEIDSVISFPSVFGLKHNSLVFDENVENRALKSLKCRLSVHVQEGMEAIETLGKTRDHISELLSTRWSQLPACVHRYCAAMVDAMDELIKMRKAILHKIAVTESFNKEFDQLQLFLLALSETSEEYIPAIAARTIVAEFPGTPGTLEAVRANGGKQLFSQFLDL